MVGLADEQGFSLTGVVNFVDNKVDPNTGTLRARVVIANPRRLLSPGLFVRIRVPIGSPRPALLVPEEAVGSDQGQKYLYILNKDDEVVYRRVKTGLLEDGLRVIESGVDSKDRVVVSGLQRVRPGVKVRPTTAAKTGPEAAKSAGGGRGTARRSPPSAPGLGAAAQRAPEPIRTAGRTSARSAVLAP